MGTTRAIMYCRQSKGRAGEDSSDALSLEAQEASILRYCQQREYAVVRTIRDHDISGERWDRPGIKDLLKAAESGEADVVVVFKLSRFSRDALYQEVTHRELKTRGVKLESVTESGVDRPLMRMVYGGMNQEANEQHRETLRSNFEARARRGLHHAKPPYGYRAERDGRRSVMRVEPEQAEVVQRIYQLRADGLSVIKIADRLNAEGVPSKNGNPWYQSTLRKMLNNASYAGYATLRGEVIGDLDPEHMPAIVERPLWQQVQRSFVYGERIPRNKATRSWLEGLVRHSCGRKMFLQWQHNTNAASFVCTASYVEAAMRCRDRPNSIKASVLEQAVRRCVELDFAHGFRDEVDAINARAARMGKPQAVNERERLEKRIVDTRASIERAREMVYRGHADELWLVGVTAKLDAELKEIAEQLAVYVDVPTPADLRPMVKYLDSIGDSFPVFPDEKKRAVLSALGVVRYQGGRIRIEYHPGYAYLFPNPTVVSAIYRPGQNAWEIAVTTSE
jgi:DNA invertase Pin-like site-specific DNA recombinase